MSASSVEVIPVDAIFERQNMHESTVPEDVYFEEVEYRDSTSRNIREWFAIPKEVIAINPFDGSEEIGTLTEEGAFIGNKVELGDPLHPSKFDARVMVLGESSIRNFCRLGKGTVVDSARLFNTRLGENVTVLPGASLAGGDPFYTVRIGNDVQIGPDAHISCSDIGEGTSIGSDVIIFDSRIGDHVTIEEGTDTLPYDVYEYFRTKKPTTHVYYSTIGSKALIGSNTAIDASAVGTNVRIGNSSIVVHTEVKPDFVLGAESKLAEVVE